MSIPFLLFCIWQATLPFNQYTFRVWEAFLTQTRLSGPFYPNQEIETHEVGDLVPYTQDAVLRTVKWRTDSEGYRNEKDCADARVVILGDSMAVGTGLSDADTFASQLSSQTHECVRSFAGGNLGQSSKRISALHLRPQWVIIALSEKSPGSVRELSSGDDRSLHGFENLRFRWIHFRKNLYWNYRNVHGVRNTLQRSFMDSDQIASQIAPNSGHDQKMHFLREQGGSEGLSENDLEEMVNSLNHFSESISSFGARLIVTFVPNKESVHYHEIGLPKPRFNERFQNHLKSAHFQYIDLISDIQEAHDPGGAIFHQLDDTHWNAAGVARLVKKLDFISIKN